MSTHSSMPTTTHLPRSMVLRARIATVVAALATLALIAACSSAASPVPTPVPTPAPTASPTPGGAQGGDGSSAVVATPSVVVTPPPSSAPPATATSSATDAGLVVTVPPGTPALVDPFISAGIATTIDAGAHAVDPSTYRQTIPGKQYTAIYVVFALKPDVVGKVTMEMTYGDIQVADPLTIDYQTINSWGDFKINFPADGIPTGVYKATITYEPTGAVVTEYVGVTGD